MRSGALSFHPVEGLPEIMPGDDLTRRLLAALQAGGLAPASGDVLVVTQKIVSKADGRYVELSQVEPGPQARELAARCRKDPRLVELVLREATEVVRAAPEVLIARHRLGFVVANAGVDQSNLPGGVDRALLLPVDPDASAARLRRALREALGVDLAVLVSDSFGRPWRLGVTGVCIGCDGLLSLHDLHGTADRAGRPLQVTQVAVADELCAAAALVTGEAAEGVPAVLVRGLRRDCLAGSRPARDLVRPLQQDLFR